MARIVLTVVLACIVAACTIALTGIPQGSSVRTLASVATMGGALLYALVALAWGRES